MPCVDLVHRLAACDKTSVVALDSARQGNAAWTEVD
jgi:hypothetical protein